MITSAGRRTEKIQFLRQGPGQDEYGEETDPWENLGNPVMARVFWGSGAERREAAQTSGSQAASFVVLATTLTRSVRVKDRIAYAGGQWDIRGIVPPERSARAEIEFNAVRST